MKVNYRHGAITVSKQFMDELDVKSPGPYPILGRGSDGQYLIKTGYADGFARLDIIDELYYGLTIKELENYSTKRGRRYAYLWVKRREVVEFFPFVDINSNKGAVSILEPDY